MPGWHYGPLLCHCTCNPFDCTFRGGSKCFNSNRNRYLNYMLSLEIRTVIRLWKWWSGKFTRDQQLLKQMKEFSHFLILFTLEQYAQIEHLVLHKELLMLLPAGRTDRAIYWPSSSSWCCHPKQTRAPQLDAFHAKPSISAFPTLLLGFHVLSEGWIPVVLSLSVLFILWSTLDYKSF